MAFKQAPMVDTYSVQRIPLIQSEITDPPSSTSGVALSNMMINVLPKKYSNAQGEAGWTTKSRPGIVSTAIPGGNITSQIRGLYIWEKTVTQVYYFVVIGTGIYTATAISGPFTAVTTWTNNRDTPVRFSEFISSTSVKKLVVLDGFEGYVFTDNTAGTKIVDADFPTPHLPFPVFLDGRLHVVKKDTGDIYCSDLDDPAVWTAGNFISSEVYPDDIQALVKIDNYILAIGLQGSEYFYDAAITLGSPLARVENTILPFGTDYPNSLASTFNHACILSKNQDGNIVLSHIQGFNHEEIPCNFLNQYIPQIVVTLSSSVYVIGHFWRDAGSLYYTISIDYRENSETLGVTSLVFTYSFEAKMWVTFTRGSDTHRNIYGPNAHKTYPIYFSQPGYGGFHTIIAGQAFNGPFIGYLTETGRGVDQLYLGTGSITNVYYNNSVTLSNLNFGTMNRKFMYRVGVDYVNDSDPLNDQTYIPRITYWDTPNGGQFETALPLASAYNTSGTTGQDFPFVTQLGAFRHRWIRTECYGALTYRYLEFDINKGQQ